jgi:hypothetical protein
MSLRQKPFETSYPRWRHLKHGYTVKVAGVQNHRGDQGQYYSVVEVEGTLQDPKAKARWPADSFRKNFEPVGRKKKAKSAVDRLLADDKD